MLRVEVQCLGSTHLGDFHLAGAQLRKQGWNRIGNMLVPNSNYCAFEDWVMPILDQLLLEQQQHGTCWTPSKVLTCPSKLNASRIHVEIPLAASGTQRNL